MFPKTFILLGPLAMMALGVALLWFMGGVRSRGRFGGEDIALGLVRGAGWVLLIAGMFLLIALMTQFAALFFWIILIVVLLAAAHRYQDGERRALFWMLTVAAEKGIPLSVAARTFADDHVGLARYRALNLAEYLEAGLPLSAALKCSGTSICPPALLAAEMGERTGALATALRQVLQQEDQLENVLRSLVVRLFYLSFLLVFGLILLTFLSIKIIPVMWKMLEEFEMEMPLATERLGHLTEFILRDWYLLIPAIVGLLALLGVGVLHYIGVPMRGLPGIRRLWWRADCAWVLRWLATSIRQQRGIPETVGQLATCFPQAVIRSRLAVCADRLAEGADWCQCLQDASIIKPRETLLFESSQRAGNLDWALDEMADSSIRRTAYRLQAILNVAFPVALVIFGVWVFFVAIAVFLPLVTLIIGCA